MGERSKPVLVLPNEEECTICLEAITNSSTIGSIPSCRHYYHDNCVLQWSSHSNSCPTCRKSFHRIENYHCQDLNTVVSSVTVRDRLLPNDAIDHIPDEFVIRPHQQIAPLLPSLPQSSHGSSMDDDLNGVCSICASADYRVSRTRSMIRCHICTSTFHLSCLGISHHSSDDIEEWYCPMCDSPQELLLAPSSRPSSRGTMLARLISPSFPSTIADSHSGSSPAPGRRSTASNRRTASSAALPASLRRINLLSDGLPSSMTRHPRTSPQTSAASTSRVAGRPGLVIHNDNDELDDDFLYSDHLHEDDFATSSDTIPSYSRSPPAGLSPVLNGGVMLRREMKNNQNLTDAEVQSWNLFDEARRSSQGNDEPIQASSAANNGAERKRRRRKRPQPSSASDLPTQSSQSHPSLGSAISPSDGPYRSSTISSSSRIASLMNQIKTPSRSSAVSRAEASTSMAIPEDINSSIVNNNSSTNTVNSPSPSSISTSPHSPSVYSGTDARSIDSDCQTDPETNSTGGAGSDCMGSTTTSSRNQKRMCINGPLDNTTSSASAPPSEIEGKTKGTPELTLNQKTEIQKHIRNNLRPLYKPTKSSSDSNANNDDVDDDTDLQQAAATTTPTEPIIRSEDSYISINKSISRKLYALILSDAKRDDGCFFQGAIDEYFAHEDKLKQLVDRCAQDELTKL